MIESDLYSFSQDITPSKQTSERNRIYNEYQETLLSIANCKLFYICLQRDAMQSEQNKHCEDVPSILIEKKGILATKVKISLSYGINMECSYQELVSPEVQAECYEVKIYSKLGESVIHAPKYHRIDSVPMAVRQIAMICTNQEGKKISIERLVFQLKALERALSEYESILSGSLHRTQRSMYNLFDFVYFSCVTVSTLGYGDIVPNSTLIRLVVVLQTIFGVMFFSMVIASLMRTQTNTGKEP